MFVNNIVFFFYIINLEIVDVYVMMKRWMLINYLLKLFIFCKSNVFCKKKKNLEDLK